MRLVFKTGDRAVEPGSALAGQRDVSQSHQPNVFETGGSPGGGGGRSNVCLHGLVGTQCDGAGGCGVGATTAGTSPANTSRFVFAGVAVGVTLVPVG